MLALLLKIRLFHVVYVQKEKKEETIASERLAVCVRPHVKHMCVYTFSLGMMLTSVLLHGKKKVGFKCCTGWYTPTMMPLYVQSLKVRI